MLVVPLVAGEGDDRGQPQVGVLQPRRQVGRADGLGHADAGAVGSASVAVGHVGGGLLAVGYHPLDAVQVHLGQRAAENGWDQKHMGNSICLEGVRHELGAGHLCHIVSPDRK